MTKSVSYVVIDCDERWFRLWLVPDGLWVLVESLIPEFQARAQGGGTAPLSACAMLTAIVQVLASGCAWRDVPPEGL